MHQEVGQINGNINSSNKTNNKKIISSKSLPEEPSTEEGGHVEDLERTMKTLAMTNGRMMIMGHHGQSIDCPSRLIERQFDQQQCSSSSSSTSTSSSSNSSIDGLNGIGCGDVEKKTSPKRSKAKKVGRGGIGFYMGISNKK